MKTVVFALYTTNTPARKVDAVKSEVEDLTARLETRDRERKEQVMGGGGGTIHTRYIHGISHAHGGRLYIYVVLSQKKAFYCSSPVVRRYVPGM